MAPHGGLKAEGLELGRVEPVRELVHLGRNLRRPRAQLSHRLRKRDLVRWRHGHGLDLDGEKGELLAEVVVQLAGNPPPLLLLSRQEAAAQVADDGLGVFALR